jgi:hypothetical protein
MDNNFMSNQQRSFGPGAANTTGSGKGRSGPDGEGKTEPLMKVAPLNGPTTENKPVAEQLLPYELNQMVQKFGSLIYTISSITEDLRKSLDNPSVKDHQKVIIIAVIRILRPLGKKIFNAGLKLQDALLPFEKSK